MILNIILDVSVIVFIILLFTAANKKVLDFLASENIFLRILSSLTSLCSIILFIYNLIFLFNRTKINRLHCFLFLILNIFYSPFYYIFVIKKNLHPKSL